MSRGRPATHPGQHGKITEKPLYDETDQQPGKDGTTPKPTRWRLYCTLRLYNGDSVQVQATASTKKAAREALERRCAERLGTPFAEAVNPTTRLETLLEQWLEQHQATDRSKQIYKTNLDRHIRPGIGQLRLRELSPAVLQAFIANLTPGTAKSCAAILSSGLNYAVRIGALASSPWQAIKLPTNEAKDVVVVTEEQQTAYIRAVERWCTGLDPDQSDDEEPRGRERGHGLPQLIRVIAGSGLRPGEALGLRVADVDPVNRRITISGQVDGKGGRTEQLKNRRSQFARRTISITEDAADAIREQLQSPAVKHYNEPVFPTWRGTYRTVNNLNRDLRAATEGLDFGVKITPRAFRSTIASRIAAKFGHGAAQMQLGHSKSDVTEKYYTAPPPFIDDYLGRLGQEKTRKK